MLGNQPSTNPTRESLKRELKAWEKAFFATHGRTPVDSDLVGNDEIRGLSSS